MEEKGLTDSDEPVVAVVFGEGGILGHHLFNQDAALRQWVGVFEEVIDGVTGSGDFLGRKKVL